MQPGHASSALPGQISAGGPPASGPNQTEHPVVGGERPVGFINISHPSTNPRRFQNAV